MTVAVAGSYIDTAVGLKRVDAAREAGEGGWRDTGDVGCKAVGWMGVGRAGGGLCGGREEGREDEDVVMEGVADEEEGGCEVMEDGW